MSTTAASETKEPPRPSNDPPQSPSLFSSLPKDIVLNILARVPRRYHPILSCVSKSLRSLVRSTELRKIRSLMGKDSFYVCFREYGVPSVTYHWFTLSQNTTTDENRLVSIPFPSQPKPHSAALMVGPEIYFVGGYYDNLSSSMWILDSRSGKLRQGPSARIARKLAAVGIVDEKIYVYGGCDDENYNENSQVEVFDSKTQTWELAPNTNLRGSWVWSSVVNPSLDKKIYVRYHQKVIVYDPRDGRCESIATPNNDCKDVCVIDNVLYIYHSYVGLMWYDSKEKEWRVVNGLNLNEYSASVITLAEYNGKLVLLRQVISSSDIKNKEIWCTLIALDRSGVEIMGKVEWVDHVLSVPCKHMLMHCLGRTD